MLGAIFWAREKRPRRVAGCSEGLRSGVRPPSPIPPPLPLQALLVHTASMEANGVSRLLGPWLTSPTHHKILCDCRADSEALQVVYGVRLQGVIDVQARL